MDLETYDAVRASLAAGGITPRIETKLALFLGGAKNANVAILAAAIWQPLASPIDQILYAQYCQELQAVGLLARITSWVAEPLVYAEGAALVAPLWSELPAPWAPGYGDGSQAFYAGLALGHALLATIRLTPIQPNGIDELQPFVVALRSIERNNARLLQTQIRLLKVAASGLSLAERERLIEAKAETTAVAFAKFLQWLRA